MNIIVELFLSFAKVGVLTFGGGMAMLPMLQRELVEHKKWVTEDEILETLQIASYMGLTRGQSQAFRVFAIRNYLNLISQTF